MPSINPIFKCPKCNKHHMSLRAKKENNGFFFTCLGRPECNHAIWLSDVIKEIKVLDQNCNKCQNGNKKISIKFKSVNLLAMLNASLIDDTDRSYTSCILCDHSLRMVLDINQSNLRGDQTPANNRSQINNRTAPPPQNPVRPNNRPPPPPTAPVNRPSTFTRPQPPPNPHHNPSSNARESFGNTSNVRCSMCNQPAVK